MKSFEFGRLVSKVDCWVFVYLASSGLLERVLWFFICISAPSAFLPCSPRSPFHLTPFQPNTTAITAWTELPFCLGSGAEARGSLSSWWKKGSGESALRSRLASGDAFRKYYYLVDVVGSVDAVKCWVPWVIPVCRWREIVSAILRTLQVNVRIAIPQGRRQLGF